MPTVRLMNASELLRADDTAKLPAYKQVVDETKDKLESLWEGRKFVINQEYEKKLLNGKLFGTRFSADVGGDYAKRMYNLMNNSLLNRDTMSEKVESAITDGEVFDLGDAVVVPHTVIVNPMKVDFNVETKPVVQLTFNLVLPEDIPEDYDMEEPTDDTE